MRTPSGRYSPFLPLLSTVSSVALASCGTTARHPSVAYADRGDFSRAVQVYDREGRRDAELLTVLAAHVLQHDAASGAPQTRDAAFSALRSMGRAAGPIVERLARRQSFDATRARALSMLAMWGDGSARSELEAFRDGGDSEIATAFATALDPRDDALRLESLLVHPSPDVRGAALTRLAQAEPTRRLLVALRDAARRDASVAVRANATRLLGRFGVEAVVAIRERLHDAEPSVRWGALFALFETDAAMASAFARDLMGSSGSRDSVEAARVMLIAGTAGDKGLARGALVRALSDASSSIRAQAAVALSASGDASDLAPLATRLSVEKDARVRLALAAPLLSADKRSTPPSADSKRAVRALIALLPVDGMLGTQAASLLVLESQTAAVVRLRRSLSSTNAAERQVAVRALGAYLPYEARKSLADSDASVRCECAAAMIARAHEEKS